MPQRTATGSLRALANTSIFLALSMDSTNTSDWASTPPTPNGASGTALEGAWAFTIYASTSTEMLLWTCTWAHAHAPWGTYILINILSRANASAPAN